MTMLKKAIMPMGKTMYIYGGGWNESDTGGGREALSFGLSPAWAPFANTRSADYSFRDYDYKKDISVIHLGLDCSGYVGWVLYNTMRDGRDYVFKSSEAVKRLSEMGLGRRIPREEVKHRRAGDIMSSACSCCSHVYICIGECSDGSLVLIHSSPSGVQLSYTPSPEGECSSAAADTVKKYMYGYYPKWMERFPAIYRDTKYLTHYEQLSNTFMTDKYGLRDMDPDKILKMIFNG